MSALDAELRDALASTALGQPLTVALERDLGMAARSVLARHGLADATVVVRRVGQALDIEVIPPPRVPNVRRISLRLG
ncbi:MAG: hypothetical protein QGH45_04980 [Myxococcota bacterium]|jgi:hypothetical protein|nr:hypothetical protein [Myxococcota bacterium]